MQSECLDLLQSTEDSNKPSLYLFGHHFFSHFQSVHRKHGFKTVANNTFELGMTCVVVDLAKEEHFRQAGISRSSHKRWFTGRF